MSARKHLAVLISGVLLCVACRTEPPEDEVPETAAARARLKQLSERPALSWLTQPDVRFSRQSARITAEVPSKEGPSPAQIELPSEASAFTRISEVQSGMTIRQRLEGSQPISAESAGGLLVFRGAFQGFDFLQRPSATQVEDFITFPTRPERPRVSYEVELTQGVAGLRLVEGVLEFVDASGDPRLRVGPANILGADNKWHDVRASLEGCAADQNPAAPWGRPVTPPGNSTCRLIFTWDDAQDGFYPAVFDPSWTLTVGNMVSPRGLTAAVLLNNNLVLVAGGISSANPYTVVNSAELYNEISGTWAATGSMAVPRSVHGMAFTTLGSPRAVAVGGYNPGSSPPAPSTLEWYDPPTGRWQAPVDAGISRDSPAVVTLNNGNIVIIGGQTDGGGCARRLPYASLYNPQTNAVSQLESMREGRVLHAATLLPDGRVLVTGGLSDCCASGCGGALQTSEILNTNFRWTLSLPMQYPHADHAATVLAGGTRVLVAGGYATSTTVSEVYNITSPSWSTPRSMGSSLPLWDVNMTTLSNNRVLVAGGGFTTSVDESTNITLLYDPSTDTWSSDNPLTTPRRGHVQVKTALGRTLVAGGAFGTSTVTVLNTSEIYDALPNGASCPGNGVCASKLCVDGVCCNTACTGACDACNLPGSPGTCSVAPLGTPGAPACSNNLVCGGTSASCPTSCSNDQWCASGYFCLNGSCQPKKPLGDTCGGANQCQSGFCADGVCCNNACLGACTACNLQSARGQCSFVPLGTPGAPACSNNLVCDGTSSGCPTACTSDQTCASGYYCLNGTCQPKKPLGDPCGGVNQCQSGFCADGVCCNNDCIGACNACNRAGALGTCSIVSIGTPGVPACSNNLVCSGTSPSCPTACTSDAMCASGYFCLNGSCQPQESLGDPCTSANQCRSGFCTDGVCCNTACTGACDACNLPGSPGTCSLVPPGTPGTPACSNNFVCNGSSASCPTVCTSDAMCASGYFCLNGSCQPKEPIGDPCTGANQCQSGLCVDGVCCNTACTGACDACNLPGSPGTCSLVPPGTPGTPACSNNLVCNGSSASCPTACTSDAMCPGGYFCLNGSCQPKEPIGDPCTGANQCQSGFCVDGVCCGNACSGSCESCNGPGSAGSCTPSPSGTAGEPVCAPYVCDGTGGACPAQCTDNSQCAAGAVCADGTCRTGAHGHIGWGCGCGTSSEGSAFLTLILLGGLLIRRRSEVRP